MKLKKGFIYLQLIGGMDKYILLKKFGMMNVKSQRYWLLEKKLFCNISGNELDNVEFKGFDLIMKRGIIKNSKENDYKKRILLWINVF